MVLSVAYDQKWYLLGKGKLRITSVRSYWFVAVTRAVTYLCFSPDEHYYLVIINTFLPKAAKSGGIIFFYNSRM
jgi:hypothetical protein